MGCVSAKTEAVDPNTGKISAEEAAKQQRRRLSVTPAHVGDISPDKAAPQVAAQDDVKQEGTQGLASAAQASEKTLRTAYFSKKGFVPYNRGKVNQDRALVKFRLKGDSGIDVFGVMDGHGEFGHFVASFVQENLPVFLAKQSDLREAPPAAITRAVKEMVDLLATQGLNTAFSGTTCVFGLRVDQQMYVANIGDSRCVLARKNENGRLVAIPLSVDQKPENPEEKARIIRAGGRVEPLPGTQQSDDPASMISRLELKTPVFALGPPGEDCGPPRVWLAEVDVPGLAMSRSIGDEASDNAVTVVWG